MRAAVLVALLSVVLLSQPAKSQFQPVQSAGPSSYFSGLRQPSHTDSMSTGAEALTARRSPE